MFLLAAGLLILATAFTVKTASDVYQRETVRQLEGIAAYTDVLIDEIGKAPDNLNQLSRKMAQAYNIKFPEGNQGLRVTFIDYSGKVLGDSAVEPASLDNHSERVEVKAALRGETGVDVRYSTSIAEKLMYVAVLDRKNKLVVRMSVPIKRQDQIINGILKWAMLAALIAILLAALISRRVARKITRDLVEVTNGAEEVANGNYNRRIIVARTDESGRLAAAVNNMSNRLLEDNRLLREKKDLIKAVADNVAGGIVAIDANGALLLVNRFARTLFNLRIDEDISGQPLGACIRNRRFNEQIQATLADCRRYETEIGDLERVLRVETSPVFFEGALVGACAYIGDITKISRLEKLRAEFVANVSHELRTPLTSIRGFIETLRTSDMDKTDSNRFLQIIELESERLQLLIDDLLTLSELDTTIERVGIEHFDLKIAIDEVLQLNCPSAVEKSVVLENRIDTGIMLDANKNRIKQLLYILTDNAIKYNKTNGMVVVTGIRKGKTLTLEVSDSGIGITTEHLPRLFERFYRVDKDRSRATGGTGLGLAIAKHIVQLYDGSIEIESEPGQGTKVIVSLPV
jgi:two-component system phosphate regulon sensor histidine kinase PhoR